MYTIGFTRKSASEFFRLLAGSGAKRLIDVRLNNVSQLAGFAKRDDLEYFLNRICGMEYVHLPELAPTKEMLGLPQRPSQLGHLRKPVPRSHGAAPNRREGPRAARRRRLPAVQRRQARPLSPAARRGVSSGRLGRHRHRSSRIGSPAGNQSCADYVYSSRRAAAHPRWACHQ